jgi:hypothetical protein
MLKLQQSGIGSDNQLRDDNHVITLDDDHACDGAC